jgi:hypothetical protein
MYNVCLLLCSKMPSPAPNDLFILLLTSPSFSSVPLVELHRPVLLEVDVPTGREKR